MNNILVVEDHQTTRKGLINLLQNSGYQVDSADDGLEAEAMITGNKYDLILVDLILPHINGLKILKKSKQIFPSTEVIVMTAHETINSAIHAMKLGAYDYLMKPLEPEKIIDIVNHAIERKEFLKTTDLCFSNNSCLLGRSKQMIEIFKILAKMADTENSVMIIGENGSGKKTLAQTIHKNSPFKNNPFIMLNCAMVPNNLSEEQAFHYLKSKVTAKNGQNKKTSKYTLYLDNIDMTSPTIQNSLLFFLDLHANDCSSQRPFAGNIRLITSSRKNLRTLMEKKILREDLFFRINTLPVYLPPLRERKVDIPLLANHFSNKYTTSPIKTISSEVLALFMKYQWPGNVQELKNIIEYSILMTTGNQITLDDLPSYLKEAEPPPINGVREKDMTLDELEKTYILKQLDAHGWDQKKTAVRLGIGRTTLWRRLKQYGVIMPHTRKLEV